MRRSLIIIIAVVVCLCVPQTKAAWTITQLTNNSTNDSNPAISGTNVVWQHKDGSDYEIYSNFAGQIVKPENVKKSLDFFLLLSYN